MMLLYLSMYSLVVYTSVQSWSRIFENMQHNAYQRDLNISNARNTCHPVNKYMYLRCAYIPYPVHSPWMARPWVFKLRQRVSVRNSLR
ncbi:hypothetical protein BGX38DRAFT_1211277 [Terfezia claveryi]|nr:hypothetical protein BGX38DRAFT_1211277 [Terfezia claveryi]